MVVVEMGSGIQDVHAETDGEVLTFVAGLRYLDR